jgi:hypothetical protein
LMDVDMSRIGLVGYCCQSGLGELNRQIDQHVPLAHWLVVPHKEFGCQAPVNAPSSRYGEVAAGALFAREQADRVIFCEHPYFAHLPQLCRENKRPMICVPMQEWLSDQAEQWGVSRFLCPTEHCYNQFKDRLPCVYFPWPVDIERFTFKPRYACKRFVFINGHGGSLGRKGGNIVQRLRHSWPDIPIAIYSQKKLDWASTAAPESNAELYAEGDVLLVPHCVDGIGLEILEAAASGMPVISTNGEPWNEYPALERINSRVERKRIGRQVDWYVPDALHLLDICRRWLGKDISEASVAARQWAEQRSWGRQREKFIQLVESA